jgi:hypothetical protein
MNPRVYMKRQRSYFTLSKGDTKSLEGQRYELASRENSKGKYKGIKETWWQYRGGGGGEVQWKEVQGRGVGARLFQLLTS